MKILSEMLGVANLGTICCGRWSGYYDILSKYKCRVVKVIRYVQFGNDNWTEEDFRKWIKKLEPYEGKYNAILYRKACGYCGHSRLFLLKCRKSEKCEED